MGYLCGLILSIIYFGSVAKTWQKIDLVFIGWIVDTPNISKFKKYYYNLPNTTSLEDRVLLSQKIFVTSKQFSFKINLVKQLFLSFQTSNQRYLTPLTYLVEDWYKYSYRRCINQL